MMIQNVDRCYQVMRCLDGTEATEEFLCREIRRQEEGAYLLVRIKEPVLAKQFTLFLEEKIRGKEFTDYKECFREDGAFYAVFRYSLNETLEEKNSKERLSLEERLRIASGLLEQLLLQNPHPYFAWCSLKRELVTVSRSLEVHLNYHLEQVEKSDAFSMKAVVCRLAEIFSFLFREELEKKLYPVLETYVKALEGERFSSYLEIYQEFMETARRIKTDGRTERLPETFWFRCWERVKKLLKVLRKLLMALLLAAAVWYVVKTFQDDSGSQVKQQVMKEIGTLVIEEQEIENGE